jgi:hypothetical protein
MNTAISRFAYRLLLRLHPAGFRDEFAAEMLWIYDEECQEGAGHLFLDGAISLLRQRCRLQHDPGQLSIASGAIITGPGIGAIRFLQAGLTASLLLGGLTFLGRNNVVVRWSGQMSCYTLTLQAPSHAEVVLGTSP